MSFFVVVVVVVVVFVFFFKIERFNVGYAFRLLILSYCRSVFEFLIIFQLSVMNRYEFLINFFCCFFFFQYYY